MTQNHQLSQQPVDGDLVVIQRNPSSGAGKGRRVLLELIRELRSRRFSVRMFSNREQLDGFVNGNRIKCRVRCLVAAGGDGTVASLVNRHPRQSIAVLPLGTENLVARHLNMPRDGAVLAGVIQGGLVRRFDVAWAGDTVFLLMASAGIDAEVVHRLHASRAGNIQRWTYIPHILKSFASYRFPKIDVTDVHTGKTVSGSHVIVSNFREYGFNLKLNADADPTDGQLDVCVFQKSSLVGSAIHAVCSFFSAQNGTHVVRFRAQHVCLSPADNSAAAVRHSPEIPLQADGDVAGQLPIDIRISAAALQLLVHST